MHSLVRVWKVIMKYANTLQLLPYSNDYGCEAHCKFERNVHNSCSKVCVLRGLVAFQATMSLIAGLHTADPAYRGLRGISIVSGHHDDGAPQCY